MSTYRYPGIKPFESSEKNQFFGRDEDIDRLSKIINTEKLVVLYSKSGLGKSSLLNAGIIPNLEKDEVNLVLKLRFGSFFEESKVEPLQVCINAIHNKTEGNKSLKSRILKKLNIGIQKSYLDVFSKEKSVLWQELKKVQQQNKVIKNFILIFDQFEELFSYPNERQEELSRAVSDILYPVIPQTIRQELEEKINENPAFLSDEEKELLYTPLAVKIVIAIRSDRLSMLDKLREFIPDIFKQFYELLPLNTEQAKEAILIPASLPVKEYNFVSDAFGFENEALNKMLAFLSKDNTQEIETFQLQVLCFHIEKKVIEKNIQKVDAGQIANIGDIYKNFYDDLLQKLTPSEQRIVRNFIEEGLIFEEEERRLNLYEGQIYKNYHINPKLLRWLVDTHIIRSEPSAKGGYIYELSHDSLIKPILDSKKQYEEGKYAGLSKKEIEERKKLEKILVERTLEIEQQKEAVMCQRDEIESQRDLISSHRNALAKKNNVITQSIMYAKKIQDVMLTSEDYIDEILPEYFILNLPKSIVSGDFYWLKKTANSIYIAVADCAGHGIPGAMISMLGMSMLKDIFKDERIIDVNIVLDNLHKDFVRYIRQTRKEMSFTYGLDISFCLIHPISNVLQYAGANQSIYLIRGKEIFEYKPDRKQIGGYFTELSSFTKHSVALENNDSIYLFTDGYANQFGGAEGRKFLNKNFKALLLSIQDYSMQEQREILNEKIIEWRGDIEQVDDILIFGLKYNFD